MGHLLGLEITKNAKTLKESLIKKLPRSFYQNVRITTFMRLSPDLVGFIRSRRNIRLQEKEGGRRGHKGEAVPQEWQFLNLNFEAVCNSATLLSAIFVKL